jgi:xanthine dehydrogenase accessory factor
MTEMYQEIADLLSRGEKAVLATVVNSDGSSPRKPGAKMLVHKDGSIAGTVGGGTLEQEVREKAGEVMFTGRHSLLHFDLSGQEKGPGICGGQVGVFLEPLMPAESLIVAGAGHIGLAAAAIGRMLGFHVTVIDPRPELNNADRFSAVDSLVVGEYADALRKTGMDSNSYVLICTSGHAFDEECLYVASRSEARYVGMIGSRKKVKEVKERLLARGVPQDCLDRVHAPVGLDIGAETSEEIAVSIMAQIVKIRRGDQP